MKNTQRKLAVLPLACLAATLAACGGDSSEPSTAAATPTSTPAATPAGSMIYTGVTDPTSSIGVNGDFYLNSALLVTMAVYVGTGIITRDMLPMFAIVAPAMLIPTLLGTRVYIGISDIAFRRIVLTLLTCSGIAMLVAAAPKL